MRHEIIPSLRYADAPRAIEFLCEAFGFERHAVHADDKRPEIIHHAQLIWNDRMLMLSTAMDDEHIRRLGVTTVAEAGGATGGLYLTVEDVDAPCRTGAGGRSGNHPAAKGPGLWRTRLHGARSRGQCVELRQLRSLGRRIAAVAGQHSTTFTASPPSAVSL